MKVSSINNNYNSTIKFKRGKNLNSKKLITNNKHIDKLPSFKGTKGACLGALGGLAWLGGFSLTLGSLPEMPELFAAVCAVIGAFFGDGIEKELKD